jgi:DNA-directed RNA polymerase specialized sigma24 family protein
MAYGRWQPYVDAEPVRAHVAMLRTFGIGIPRIRKLGGISGGTMTRLLYGMHGRGPSKRVRTTTADRILTVKASLDAAAPSALVDGTGTRRRLRALVVIGWPQVELARRLGVDRVTVNEQLHRGSSTAYASTARAVRDLYEQLWNVVPESDGVGARWAAEARQLARTSGWVPPAAWDDDYIDSPAARPDLGEHVDRYAALSEDARWLMDAQGYTREQAAHRLGITARHLERALAYTREQQEDVA